MVRSGTGRGRASTLSAGPDTGSPYDALSPAEVERRVRVDELVRLGGTQLYRDLDKMQQLSEEAYELASRVGADGSRYERGMAGAITLIAGRLMTLEQHREAFEQATAGLGLLDPERPDPYRAKLLSLLAEARFSMGDYAEGLSQENRARQLFHDLGDLINESRAFAGLAFMYFTMEHIDIALTMMKQGLDLCREAGSPDLLVMQLNNMAWILLASGDADASFEAASESLELCHRENCLSFEPAVLDTVAAVCMARGDTASAEGHIRRSIEISHQIDDTAGVASGEAQLARLMAATGRLAEGIDHAERALAVKDAVEKKADIAEIHHLLTDLYERSDRYQEALGHMKQFYALEKDKAKEQADNRLAVVRVQHQNDSIRKDAEIYRLRTIALESEIEQRRLDQIRLETENSLDPLTGLFNRRHLPVLKEQMHDSHRRHLPASLLLLDIDHFKRVNDTYGHLAGDQVIQAIAERVRDALRERDIPLRFGGEEFLVFLPDTASADAVKAAEAVRAAIEAEPVAYGDFVMRVTVSVGVATSQDAREEELRSVIDRADQALYHAKESGRNRVEVG